MRVHQVSIKIHKTQQTRRYKSKDHQWPDCVDTASLAGYIHLLYTHCILNPDRRGMKDQGFYTDFLQTFLQTLVHTAVHTFLQTPSLSLSPFFAIRVIFASHASSFYARLSTSSSAIFSLAHIYTCACTSHSTWGHSYFESRSLSLFLPLIPRVTRKRDRALGQCVSLVKWNTQVSRCSYSSLSLSVFTACLTVSTGLTWSSHTEWDARDTLTLSLSLPLMKDNSVLRSFNLPDVRWPEWQ